MGLDIDVPAVEDIAFVNSQLLGFISLVYYIDNEYYKIAYNGCSDGKQVKNWATKALLPSIAMEFDFMHPGITHFLCLHYKKIQEFVLLTNLP